MTTADSEPISALLSGHLLNCIITQLSVHALNLLDSRILRRQSEFIEFLSNGC
jgi:hypothetical protein